MSQMSKQETHVEMNYGILPLLSSSLTSALSFHPGTEAECLLVLLPRVSRSACPVPTCAQTGVLPVRHWHHLVVWLVSHNVIDEIQTPWWTGKKITLNRWYSHKRIERKILNTCYILGNPPMLFVHLYLPRNVNKIPLFCVFG